MKVSVQFDARSSKRFLDDVHNAAVDKALTQSLNRAAAKTKTGVKRKISQKTGVTQKSVADLIKVKKASANSQSSSLSIRGKTPNAIRFNARETKKHLSIRTFRKTQKVKTGFIGNSGRTAFKRKGSSRLPIRPLYGPNVARAFGAPKNIRVYQRFAGFVLAKEFDRTLKYQLSRIRKK